MGAGGHDDKSIGRSEDQRQFMGEIIRMFRSIILGKKKTVSIRTETRIVTTGYNCDIRRDPHTVIDKGETSGEFAQNAVIRTKRMTTGVAVRIIA